tara:strand:+ start:219 stop:821 length:603 start_codon:yes stop_codon:yes gene_type:complete
MNQSEFKDFKELLATVADYYRVAMKPGTVSLWWNALAGFDFETVKRLMNEHVQTAKFMPTISELLDSLKALDGRPDAEEAWSIVARSLNDEGVTIVWTEEMSQAFGVALGLQNDRIAARMAFKESYENLVKESRKQGKAAKWSPSLGHDVGGREGPLLAAVKQGKLAAPHVAGLLPHKNEPSHEVKKLLDRAALNLVKAA